MSQKIIFYLEQLWGGEKNKLTHLFLLIDKNTEERLSVSIMEIFSLNLIIKSYEEIITETEILKETQHLCCHDVFI